MALTEEFIRDEGTGVSRQEPKDSMRPQMSPELQSAIAERDAEFPRPDAHTVLRVQPKTPKDKGVRTLDVVIDGRPATLTLNVFDIISALNSTPIKH